MTPPDRSAITEGRGTVRECPGCHTSNTVAGSDAKCEKCGFDIWRALPYAGFRKRATAFVLDAITLLLPLQLFRAIGLGDSESLAYQVIWSVTVYGYFAVMESLPRQATFGKRIVGLCVTDLSGHRITFLRSLVRAFSRTFSGILGIGFFMALFTAQRQTLHDKIASTLVLEGYPK